MSKTIETQIEKSIALINGVRNNINSLRDKGVNEEALDAMQHDMETLAELNGQCEELREKLKNKVKEVNAVFDNTKQSFYDLKRIIKNNYPQEDWVAFGVMDKR